MDRLSTLEIFRKVVDRNGFSAAARDLGLSNASVSKAIKELEAQLGAQLIVRTTRSLHLTDVGQAYYQRVGGVLDALDDADELVRSETATPRGRLRLAAPLSLGLVALQEALLSFCNCMIMLFWGLLWSRQPRLRCHQVSIVFGQNEWVTSR